MYEYAPRPEKKREKRFLLFGAILAVALFAASRIPGVLFPGGLQFLSVACCVVLILMVGRCLLCNYVYRVGEPSDSPEGAEFSVVECYGNRRTTVCRILVSEILSVEEITPSNRKERLRACRGQRFYHYIGEWFSQGYYLLKVRDGEGYFYIKIHADSRLLQSLRSY